MLIILFIMLAGLMLKVIDRQRQAVGFDVKGFLDGYKYSVVVDTSNKVVSLSTGAMTDTGIAVKKTTDNSLAELKINVNLADESEMQKLPGIGPVLAKRIVDYRKANGKFNEPDDLIKVNGIGEKKLAKMKEYIEF